MNHFKQFSEWFLLDIRLDQDILQKVVERVFLLEGLKLQNSFFSRVQFFKMILKTSRYKKKKKVMERDKDLLFEDIFFFFHNNICKAFSE